MLRLAESKARSAALEAGQEDVVIGADTTVADRGELLGKPADPQDALRMLRQLRGHSHQVFTAVAVLRMADGLLLTDLCVTDVPMRQYTDVEIQAYIDSGDALDKAGAYAIQHAGFHPVQNLSGCYANVVGLPLCHLERILRRLSLGARQEIPEACQSYFDYHCPVYSQVLAEMVLQ